MANDEHAVTSDERAVTSDVKQTPKLDGLEMYASPKYKRAVPPMKPLPPLKLVPFDKDVKFCPRQISLPEGNHTQGEEYTCEVPVEGTARVLHGRLSRISRITLKNTENLNLPEGAAY